MRFASRLLTNALLLLLATEAFAVPISDLHGNDANGVASLNGQSRTVQGTVTVPKGLFQTGNVDVHIQDATGGIDVFAFGAVANALALYDSVEVTGTITQFNGLTELAAPITITDLGGTANVQPAPLVLTCLQVASSFQFDNTEPNESRLIHIVGVSITGGTWPAAGSNGTLTLTDASGSCTMFIDRDTQLDGSSPPPAVFNVTGVMRQFDSSSPFVTGYQIVPRFLSDVTGAGCPGPEFLTQPQAGGTTSSGATITWTTDSPSTSVVEYGLTSGGYSVTVSDPTPTTNHSVALTGLAPRTLYYYRALSTDVDGTCNTVERTLVTFPTPGTPGDIDVYFTKSVDHAVSSGTLATGNVDMTVPLIALIDAAQWTIDGTFYYFQIPAVTDALVAAKNRGVAVRLILGIGNSLPDETADLTAAGIPFIFSNFGGNHAEGIMHSKYLIVDAKPPVMATGSATHARRDGGTLGEVDPKDSARLWTGSWNCFPAANDEANNSVVIQDYGLAIAFTQDFDQMWGSSTMTANAATAKMGAAKREVMSHQFEVGGIRVEAYQSPSDQPETRMIQYIQQAQRSQLFCIFSFTSDPLSFAMRAHRDSIPGFAVRGVFDTDQVSEFSEWCKLDGQASCTDFWSPRADVFQDTEVTQTLLHHKYQILDIGWPEATVWTGSHNWSAAAKTTNDENTVVFHDPTIANLYYQEWYARYRGSGGQVLLEAPGAPRPRLALTACRPNPTQGATNFEYGVAAAEASVSLGIYDVTGRLVKSLVNGPVRAGSHQARWDGRDENGQPQRAGVYFYRLKSGAESVSRLLVLTP